MISLQLLLLFLTLTPSHRLCPHIQARSAQFIGMASRQRYTYEVRGKVYDETSNPMAHTTVCWIPAERPINGRIPCTNTDDDGSFTLIVNDVPDKYVVCASTTTSPFVFVGEDPSHRVACTKTMEFGAGDQDRKVDLRFEKPKK